MIATFREDLSQPFVRRSILRMRQHQPLQQFLSLVEIAAAGFHRRPVERRVAMRGMEFQHNRRVLHGLLGAALFHQDDRHVVIELGNVRPIRFQLLVIEHFHRFERFGQCRIELTPRREGLGEAAAVADPTRHDLLGVPEVLDGPVVSGVGSFGLAGKAVQIPAAAQGVGQIVLRQA